jgi:hypothetical protein
MKRLGKSTRRLHPTLDLELKALLQFTAQVYPGYDYLTQGAGFLNPLGAVRLSRYFPTAGKADGYSAGENIVWGNAECLDNIVWGSTSGFENIVWGNSGDDNTSLASAMTLRTTATTPSKQVRSTRLSGKACSKFRHSRLPRSVEVSSDRDNAHSRRAHHGDDAHSSRDGSNDELEGSSAGPGRGDRHLA